MFFFFFLMIRRPPRSTLSSSSAASDVYKRQVYTECKGFVQGSSWGKCWKPCVPGGPWADVATTNWWLEMTVWPDSVALELRWDSALPGFDGSVSSNFVVGGTQISALASLSSKEVSLTLTESGGSLVQAAAELFPVSVTTDTGTILARDSMGDVMLEVPTDTPKCGYSSNCSPPVEILLEATNSDVVPRALRLSISRNFPLHGHGSVRQSTPNAEITGFSLVVLDEQGAPTGVPVQISKNWHSGSVAAYWGGYDGMWWTANMFTRLPARARYSISVRFFYQRYGNLPAFSHAQLSLVGYSRGWLWEEAALFSGGESICFDPLGTHTRAFVTDVRPSLMDGQWKQNVGGGDFLVYFDSTGAFVYLKALDPQIHSSGPCLTNATYYSITADGAIQSRVQISGGRTNDWVRVLFHIQYTVVKQTNFSRLAFYQFGADRYSYHNTWQRMVVGQGPTQIIRNVSRTCTGKDAYDGGSFRDSLGGVAPWWIYLGPNNDSTTLADSTMVVGDKGLVIRSFKARIGGVEQSSPSLSMLCDKVELSPPEGTSTLLAGDFVDMRLELLTLPRGDEYVYTLSQMPSSKTLQKFKNTQGWQRVAAAAGISLRVVALSAAVVESHLPVRVRVADGSNRALFRVAGNTTGFVPIVICGLTTYQVAANHGLWTKTGAGNFTLLNQHDQYPTDYWQTNYVRETGTYEIVFNIEIFELETVIAFGPRPTPTQAPTTAPTSAPTAALTSFDTAQALSYLISTPIALFDQATVSGRRLRLSLVEAFAQLAGLLLNQVRISTIRKATRRSGVVVDFQTSITVPADISSQMCEIGNAGFGHTFVAAAARHNIVISIPTVTDVTPTESDAELPEESTHPLMNTVFIVSAAGGTVAALLLAFLARRSKKAQATVGVGSDKQDVEVTRVEVNPLPTMGVDMVGETTKHNANLRGRRSSLLTDT
eukprot:TRINITY_DN244_c0_g1_i3.p1 TRINITY_DN244_c0_g1~~TRINITY_DN244_c0_g1_i3.p1  ORF type:complete len:940 (+),score=120.88 TRINITY_DN244_c0_g1_i3:45-2864(+)